MELVLLQLNVQIKAVQLVVIALLGKSTWIKIDVPFFCAFNLPFLAFLFEIHLSSLTQGLNTHKYGIYARIWKWYWEHWNLHSFDLRIGNFRRTQKWKLKEIYCSASFRRCTSKRSCILMQYHILIVLEPTEIF